MTKTDRPHVDWLSGGRGACMDCDYRTHPGPGEKAALAALAEHGKAFQHLRLYVGVPVFVPGLHGTGNWREETPEQPAIDGAVANLATQAAVAAYRESLDWNEVYKRGRLRVAIRDAVTGELPRRPRCKDELATIPGSTHICGYTHCYECAAHATMDGPRGGPYTYTSTCGHRGPYKAHVGGQDGDEEVQAIIPPGLRPAPTAPAGRRQTTLFGNLADEEGTADLPPDEEEE